MKKIIIVIFCLLMFTGCKNNDIEKLENEKFLIGHTLEDGRGIHFSFDVPYKDTYVSDALLYNEITIDEFINSLEYIGIYRDGGSKLYKYDKKNNIYGNENFFVVLCNSLDNVKDIYVAKNKESLSGICSNHIDEFDDISMYIKEGTLTNRSVTVIINDNSDRENIYGASYKIEKEENGIWIELESKNEMVFNSIGYIVNEDNTLEFDIDWEYFYGKLKNGKYRLLKDFGESGEGFRNNVSVEFVIE